MNENSNDSSNQTTVADKATVHPNAGKPCLLARYHDLSAFTSKDAARYVIQGVHLDVQRRFVEATDGRMLVRVPVTEHVDEFPAVTDKRETCESAIVPVAALKKALANVPARTTLPVLAHVRFSAATANGDGAPKATMTATDLDAEHSVTTRTVEEKYPDTDVVIPNEFPKLSIALASGLLKRLCEYADKHGAECGGNVDGTTIRFELVDELSPVRVSFDVKDAFGDLVKVQAVLMPCRIN